MLVTYSWKEILTKLNVNSNIQALSYAGLVIEPSYLKPFEANLKHIIRLKQ
ncbi:hypothetical protein RO3G_08701 [Rhizopus delemar RA 99-880]|uniref:Uncharacterized protein n=1 Tax=Rhizopus delemar (strain RA 99-880 / ATCC MYA-4621 / FGSC 9543 / NRRL 43880) TaxID=246409 RepID=I1C6B6_RHIO9|nr:hypothetical protein RO3G_08701 [Rhizopus delemar RA 99-880]|eukprot:EIE83996.1 hypothetical protein RO3G_08701 [Rhizopus delemar RA 99-880]